MAIFNRLTKELLRLRAELPNIPFLIGGGMGLYLRSQYLNKKRSPRYPKKIGARSTKDLDLILTAEIIADSEQMNRIRDALNRLGYEATSKYFQFAWTTEDGKEVEIDLITSPPYPDDKSNVKTKGFRARPHDSSKIHGRIAKEARDIHRNPISIDLSEVAIRLGIDIENPAVLIPSSLNYLILKLHAFSDRKDDASERSDFGRHHALDLFSIVIDMSSEDWRDAESHFDDECAGDHIQRAISIQQEYFAHTGDLGVERIQENKTYQRNAEEFDQYLDHFVQDMNELFSGCPETQE